MKNHIDILTAQDQMQAYIIMNLNRIQNLIKPYKIQRDALMLSESGLWHIEIDEQYKKILRSVIAVDLSINLSITPLDALLFVEDLDVNQL